MSYRPSVVHAGEALGRPSRNAAKAALEAHLEVLKGEPLRKSLSEALRSQKGLGGQERRFAALATRELSRHQRMLDLFAKLLGEAPSQWVLKEDQALIRYVLWRRLFTESTAQKAVNEAKLPGPIRPRSVKDAVLERIATAELPEPELPEDPVERAATLHSFPNWLARAIAESGGAGEIDAILSALNIEPSLILRARPAGTRDEVIASLSEEGVRADPLDLLPDALVIRDPGNRVFETKPMKAGRLHVQDLGSQLIAELCRPVSGFEGSRVADICAGAGGKTITLADRVGAKGRVLASDLSRKRLQDARERSHELGLRNVSFPVPVPFGELDAVLIDAPCSGVGSIAREPDQKWKLSAKSPSEFAAKQRQLLKETAGALRPGAVLVYATCSLLREEDEGVVEGLLKEHPDFELQPASEVLPRSAAPAIEGPYLRAWPNKVPGGGFFAARMVKRLRG